MLIRSYFIWWVKFTKYQQNMYDKEAVPFNHGYKNQRVLQ